MSPNFYEFQFESSMDPKEIVISNVTCSERVQILTLLEFTYKHIGRISEKYRVGSIVFIC